jgi:hypothetical protein
LATINVNRNGLFVEAPDDIGIGEGQNSLRRITEIWSPAHETTKGAAHKGSDIGRLAFQSQPSQVDEIRVYICHIVHEEP